MEPLELRDKHGPEYYIQEEWTEFLEAKGWLVERMVGNAFQKGIPDLFISHPEYGQRWVDIKVYGEYSFTPAQKHKWPIWEAHGVKIWILGAESREACTKAHMLEEYPKLMEPPNWREFWKSSWDEKPDIDKLLGECE